MLMLLLTGELNAEGEDTLRIMDEVNGREVEHFCFSLFLVFLYKQLNPYF